jgi:predicted P-loop ATPase
VPADPQCKDLSRLYFLPRTRVGVPLEFHVNEGAVVDVDDVLREANGAASKKPVPIVDGSGTADLGVIRDVIEGAIRGLARSQKSDPEKRERDKQTATTLRAFLDAKKFAEPGGRDGTLNRAMSALAWALPSGTPASIVTAVIRPSLAASSLPEDADDPVAYWVAEAEDMYVRAQRRRVDVDEDDAKSRAANTASLVATLQSMKEKKRTTSTIVEKKTVETTDDILAWTDQLERERRGYAASGSNVRIILANAPEVGKIRWNIVSKKIELSEDSIFFGQDPDVLPINVVDWLRVAWNINVSTNMVTERLIAVAKTNSFNPLAEFLDALAWDGVPRLDTWLTVFLRAEVVTEDGDDISHWIKRLGRMWLISMVARALDPGCQVDTVPILEGKQGARKTSTLRILGGQWHTDSKITLGDKDSLMLAGENWIVELAEVSALKRGELETIKGFLTARVDKYREPYGRAIARHPRMCTFVGTTNEKEGYLIDPTGNRRYWPIRVGQIDLDGLTTVRDQLLAEAVVAYHQNEKWWFETDDAAAFEEAITLSRGPGADPYEDMIREWWPRSGNKTGWTTTNDVALRGLQLSKEKVTRAEQMRIAGALRALGWARRKQRSGKETIWAYYPPTPAEPVKVTDPNISSIAEARAKKGEPR